MKPSLLTAISLVIVWSGSLGISRVSAQSDKLGETPPDQQAAITALKGITSNLQKNRDGTVRFIRFSKKHVEDKHLDQIAVFQQLDYLAVLTPQVTDVGLANIEGLTNLDSLILTNCQATDKTAALLGGLARLQTLELAGTRISNDALEVIGTLKKLTHLSLANTAIDDRGLESLARLPFLQSINLSKTRVTDAVFEKLSGIASLKSIYLDDTSVTGKDIGTLNQLEHLEQISLCGTRFEQQYLADFKEIASLREVILRRTSLTNLHLGEIAEMIPAIRFRMTPEKDQRLSAFERYLAGSPLAAVRPTSDNLSVDPDPDVLASVSRRFKKRTDEVPDFQRHVVPMLGTLGCNGRACHGSFQGKGGFSLSLFGYDFSADHAALTDEFAGRVLLDDPAESLVLLKPTGGADHGGGKRYQVDSWQYNLLSRWIEAGAPAATDLHVAVNLQITPNEILFRNKGQQVKLTAVVTWDDGRREDVTRLARMKVIDDQVAVVGFDAVLTSRGSGDTHLIVSYDKAVVAVPVIQPVSRLTGRKYPAVPTPTQIDKLVVAKLAKLGIVPAALSSDEDFLRRVSLDISGTLPSPDQIESFVNDASTDKRSRTIDELLDTTAYIDWWAMRLTDLSGCNSQQLGSTDMNSPAALQWQAWMRRRVADNVGWDKIAAGLLLANSRLPGQTYDEYVWEQSSFQTNQHRAEFTDLDRPMHYYWARSDISTPQNKALSFGYIFLGVRLQCAQCHKHPFDQWSKQDFDEFTQFFSRLRWGTAPDSTDAHNALRNRLGVPEKLDTAALRRQMYMRVSAEGLPIPWREVYVNAAGKDPQTARLLGGDALDLNQFADPREPLFAWLVGRDNPYFARAFVNRIWHHYFGRGLVDPVDDISAGNPASNEPLLDYLAHGFIESGFDIKWLHRQITNSRTYQLGWQTNQTNRNDKRHFSHVRLRRLQAEVLVDAIFQATASDERNRDFLHNTDQRKITLHPGNLSPSSLGYALAIFGKPTRSVNCDCERSTQPTLLQSLYVKNDKEILEQIEREDGWLAGIARQLGEELKSETGRGIIVPANLDIPEDKKPASEEIVRQAYLRTLSRLPADGELDRGVAHLSVCESTIEGTRELIWALLNTQEFITNH
jgi:hypothetical protein